MSNVAESARPASSDEGFDEVLDSIADSFARSPRSPVLGSPADHGLEFENVTFPSEDGTPLEGWFVPAAARTVVIVNHPRFFSRSGLPASVEPWRTMFEATGNDIDVDLVPDIALLHGIAFPPQIADDLREIGYAEEHDRLQAREEVSGEKMLSRGQDPRSQLAVHAAILIASSNSLNWIAQSWSSSS